MGRVLHEALLGARSACLHGTAKLAVKTAAACSCVPAACSAVAVHMPASLHPVAVQLQPVILPLQRGAVSVQPVIAAIAH